MKALFFCRTDKTLMMIELAKIWKEKGWLEEAHAFVAYYDSYRPLLTENKEVAFTSCIGTTEIFEKMKTATLDWDELARIEKEYTTYSIELWNMIYSESYLSHAHPEVFNHPSWSTEEKLLYVQLCFQTVEAYFDRVQPDCIVDFAAVSIIRIVLDKVAEKRGIPYLWPHFALLKNRFYVYRRGLGSFPHIENRYTMLLETNDPCIDGYDYLDWFLKKEEGTVYSFTANDTVFHAKKRQPFFVVWKWCKKHIFKYIHIKKIVLFAYNEIQRRMSGWSDPCIRYNFQLYKNLPSIKLYRMWLSFWRKSQLWITPHFYEGDITEPFVLFTLHIQPEASTSLYAPFFVDQYAVVEQMSRALPVHWKIVVKPNRWMIGKESPSLYRKLAALPNVIVVSPERNIQELIEQSIAITTITGTVGFEGALRGKKTILFSDQPIWSMLKNVTICTDFTKLHDVFRSVESYVHDDRTVAAYLQAIHDTTFPLEKDYIWKGDYTFKTKEARQAIETIAEEIYHAYQQETRS